MVRVWECDHVVEEHGHEMLHWNVVAMAVVDVHVQLMVHWWFVDTVVVAAEGAVCVAVGGQQIVYWTEWIWLVVVVVLNVY